MEENFKDLFRNPPQEYRGVPFWAWNCKIEKDAVDSQLEIFQRMGMGGACIHPRIGLDTPYLGTEFMEAVQESIADAQARGMKIWLYDEDKWPSGFGGGRVTQRGEFRNRYLLFSPHLYKDGHHHRDKSWKVMTIDGDLTYLASYRIELDQAGVLVSYHRLADRPAYNSPADVGSMTWHAYLCVCDRMSWFNNQSYVDTLNPKAVEYFSQVTYDAYANCCREEFGKAVPAIFTDEPQFNIAENLSSAFSQEEIGIPYTDDFDMEYQRLYGVLLLDILPEIIWEQSCAATHRYQFYRMVAHRFATAYAGTLGAWCEKHDILFAGHLMRERDLEAQTRSVGETMESYLHFGYPGIDMLANRYEYATAKQAQSVARQCGRPGILSELYGVTGWGFDFKGHKTQGDWQAALGVTQRILHLAWMQMGGEAKRDYPAPIDFHSPWYVRYRTIEDHFSRVNLFMTAGHPVCRIVFLHPVESYWFSLGPDDQTKQRRSTLEAQFSSLIELLLFHHFDFDCIAESLVDTLYKATSDNTLHIGTMQYGIVIIPELDTIRQTTVDMLAEFQSRGGKLIFIGTPAGHVDGNRSPKPALLAASSICIPYGQESILKELEPYRDVSIRNVRTGREAESLVYQLRETDDSLVLFIAQGKPESQNIVTLSTGGDDCHELSITVHGEYRPILWDTLQGESVPLPCVYVGGDTQVQIPCGQHDSILIQFEKGEKYCPIEPADMRQPEDSARRCIHLSSPVDYRLSESNLLLLDMAQYSVDGGAWQDREEILRIDNQLRKQWGYIQRTDSFPQPWLSVKAPPVEHFVKLRFQVESKCEVPSVAFIFEGEPLDITFNGVSVIDRPRSTYLDAALHRVPVGNLRIGMNEILLTMPYSESTDLEWCYLMGNFGVQVQGSIATVIEKPEKLGFGDYGAQGFPFYGGNVTYITQFETDDGEVELTVPCFAAPVIGVTLDGSDRGIIFKEPYSLSLGTVSKGIHHLEITSYGNRVNQFGPLHDSNIHEGYWGPEVWRTEGPCWSYSYQLKRMGVLSDPVVTIQ